VTGPKVAKIVDKFTMACQKYE